MAKVSMRDVASRAGVSVATVSHVINNTRFVSQDTRQRVMQSIQELNFRPDPVARSFKTGRSNLIAFLVPDIANSFFSTLIEEVEDVIGREGYRLLVTNTKEIKQLELEKLHVLSNGLVDGLILASTLDSYQEIVPVLTRQIPMVFLDRKLQGCPCDTVIVEDYHAMYQGVEHLISLGHKKIGYITGLPHLSTTHKRLEAYKDALQKHHLYQENLVQIGTSMSRLVSQNLNVLLKEGCTALAVANNVMTNETVMQLLSRGLHPGREIDLLGYKESNQSQYGLQHMNLIYQPTVALGRTAGEQMLERLHFPDHPVREILLQAEFVPSEAEAVAPA